MKRTFWESCVRALWCVLVLSACGGPPASQPGTETRSSALGDAGPPIQYVYDESRRLVGVYDGAGASAQYVYDPGGNLLEIKRLSEAELGLFDFTPNAGPPGADVILTGVGFSPALVGNTVRFNGVDAIVSAASPQRLVVTIPANATTGPVSVTVDGATVPSHEDFIVTSPVLGPVITGFSPVGGPVDSVVTITGSNFDPDRLFNRVFLGDIQASVLTSSASQLEVKVSQLGATGAIRVSTPSGRATSSEDFLVLPVGAVPAMTDTRLQAEVGGASSAVSLADSTRKAVLSFSVRQGEQVSLVVTSVVLGGANQATLVVHDQMGGQVGNFSLAAAGGVFDIPMATRDTVYTLVVRLSGTTTGFNASFALVRAVRGMLEKDGVSATFTGQVGQNGIYEFSGMMGARLGLGVTSVSTTPAGGGAVIRLLKPDGTLLVDCSNFYVPGNCDVPVLPMTGTYSLTVNPSGTVTATVGLLLSTSLGDVLTVDGPAHTFSTARVGQDGFYTFSANANSNLTLLITGNNFGSNTLVRILRPDGTQLTSQTTGSATGYTVDFTPPTTGTYGITVDPYQASIGQMTLQLVEEASGSAGTVDGVETTVVLNAGQNGRYTFSGTMGARLGLGVTSVSTTPAGGSAVIKLLKPDGTLLVDCSNFYVPGNCDVPVLPMTGTYSLTVNPSGTVTATVGLLLSTSLGDVLTVDGPAHTFSTARVGQDGFYTFSANANSNLTLLITGNSFGSNTLVRILRPDGAQLTSQTTGSATGYTVNFTPPTTGTYGITVDPYQASIGQLSLGIKTAGAPSAPAQADVRK